MKISRKGQAMVEQVVMLPLLVIAINLIVWMGRIQITRVFLQQGARWGTDLMQYRNWGMGGCSTEKVKSAVRGFFYGVNGSKIGRKLDSSKIKIKVVDGNGNEINGAVGEYETMDNMIKATMSMGGVDRSIYCVEIWYPIGIPTIFKVFQEIMPGGGDLPDKLWVSARSAIISIGAGYVPIASTPAIPPAPPGGGEE
ncbi:MAG: hypothetical protein BWY26_00352 [Elusimicrobia bacterium ADurb.Bin231]|nr:MAG: hypothetical protein BWY26_00352 [Elusimicrobia bacterium ADurb.Bin231]